MIYVWSDASYRDVQVALGSFGPYEVLPVGHDLYELTSEDVVLAMGYKALGKIQAAAMLPSSMSLRASRGQRIKAEGPSFLTTHDPRDIWTEWSLRGEIRWDAQLARRLHTTGTLRPKVGDYRWVDTAGLGMMVDEIKRRADQTGKPVRVAHDTETMGFFPWYPEVNIVSTQWSIDPGHARVFDHTTDPVLVNPQTQQYVRWLMTAPEVRVWGANLKFDLVWEAYKWGIECTNFTFDTVLAGSLVDENRSNSLGWHAKAYTPLGGYDDDMAALDKSKMEELIVKEPDKFRVYSGGDADATLQSGARIQKKLHLDFELERFYLGLLHPAARAFERVESRGLLVDQERFRVLRAELVTEIQHLTARGWAMVPKSIRAKFYENPKLSLAAFLVDFLFDHREGLRLKPTVWSKKKKYGKNHAKHGEKFPSTSIKDHLGQFRHHARAGGFIQTLEEINSATKTLQTYIDGFLEHLRPDGRFHPTYALHNGSLFEGKKQVDDAGTVTGRLSAKDPAVQTIPKHTRWAKRLRACYVPPPGMVFWESDFSQGELRIAACVAREANMIQAYATGMDLHGITGSETEGMGYEELMRLKKFAKGTPENDKAKEVRQGGKAGNFGWLYGMSPSGLDGHGGFVAYAWQVYGVRVTAREAARAQDTFFGLWPALLDWHDRQRELARRHKFVRSPLGRIRHLPLIDSPDQQTRRKAERHAINSPVQATLSDLCIDAAARIEKELDFTDEVLCVIGSTHDALYGYARAKDAHQNVSEVARCMANGRLPERFGWDHQLEFPCEIEIGEHWGSMEEMDLVD
jgi:DNA polymerase I-like protein with 3'-5' exonuclease and polymerase domains